jgi:hypothetical protein
VRAEEADLPFPLGFGGLDGEEVARAERINLALGVTDPLDSKLSVVNWLYQHYRDLGDSEIANQLKEAYWSLREQNADVVSLARMGELDEATLLRRLINGQKWLAQEHEKWATDSPDADADGVFQKALDGWVAMEAHLRGEHGYRGCIHGEGRRCPDEDLDVVRCDACSEDFFTNQKRSFSNAN